METRKSYYSVLCTEEFLFEAWKAIKSKNASGGIDGITLACFDDNLQTYISELSNDLKAGTWSPEPYLSIEIPKKKSEVRKLGLLSVKDKIVQYAIKTLVEPLFENIFMDSSYGYRPNKGHTKAVRRALSECCKKKNKWVLRLDIDNYFDTINHHLLAARLHALISDEEIVRLIMLSVQMGIVNKHLKWSDNLEGVPQGAILSPLLSNFYLHPFDKYVQTLTRSYVRYADDFCLMCETHEQAKSWLKQVVSASYRQIANRAVLTRMMSEIDYLSNEYQLYKKRILQDYVELYDFHKGLDKEEKAKEQNKKIIEQRKAEYRKREGEGSELLVNTFGCFVGLSGKGITVKRQGKVIHQKPLGALSHITISSKGVTLSSNLIDYCLANKITIDFFNSSGGHTGSILSNKYIENTLWNKQAQCGKEKRLFLATCMIEAKLKNQFYLVKYFHKYHKHCYNTLGAMYEELSAFNIRFKTFVRNQDSKDEGYLTQLVGQEAQGAVKYWGYVRELLADDKVGFVKRERKGATDLVNCMLNYGYALLYTRVWQALLGAKLNPFDSIIHVRQPGKPTFVYDVVEMFRSQVVDRVVISLVQKGPSLKVEKGMLENGTKKLLIKNVLERLNRYEKYRGEEITMEQIIRRQANEMAAYIGEGERYKPYIAKW